MWCLLTIRSGSLSCSAESRETNVSVFISNRGQKAKDDALQLAKEFSEAEAQLARSKKGRLELLEEAYNGNCAKECKEQWLQCAVSLIEKF